MNRVTLILATGLLLAVTAGAQDPKNLTLAPTLSTPAHSGSSPFDPPVATDNTFVVDTGPGLDTGCTFRSGGPLIFTININRVVGDVNADGTLASPQDLINN